MHRIRPVNRGIRPEQPTRPLVRGWMFFGAAALSGTIAAVAAAAGSGPFAGLRTTLDTHLVHSDSKRQAISAGKLFPSPRPVIVHEVVSVYTRPKTSTSPSTSKDGEHDSKTSSDETSSSSTSSSGGESDNHDSEDRGRPSASPTPPSTKPTPTPMPTPTPSPTASPSPSPSPTPCVSTPSKPC